LTGMFFFPLSPAISCGLHRITSVVYQEPPESASYEGSLLGPPMDQIDLGDRILAFWAVFTLDKTCAVVTGLPSSLPTDDSDLQGRIETPWPRTVRDYAEVCKRALFRQCLGYQTDNVRLLLTGSGLGPGESNPSVALHVQLAFNWPWSRGLYLRDGMQIDRHAFQGGSHSLYWSFARWYVF